MDLPTEPNHNLPVIPILQVYLKIGQPDTPFKINGARELTYGPIATPKGGDVIHQGASLKVENTKEIMITFETLGTYLSSKKFENLWQL